MCARGSCVRGGLRIRTLQFPQHRHYRDFPARGPRILDIGNDVGRLCGAWLRFALPAWESGLDRLINSSRPPPFSLLVLAKLGGASLQTRT